MEYDEQFLVLEYKRILDTGYALAGGLTDLSQRASVYFHMYEDSGGRNIFPLIAAHGALWASGYFAKGMRAGRFLSVQYAYSPKKLFVQYQSLKNFANAFRDINRRVCAEAYGAYHFTKLYGRMPFAASVIPAALLESLNSCHKSFEDKTVFSKADRKELFKAFFLWEQETIVSPAVEIAIKRFNWPSVKWLAMRPKIEFSYLGRNGALQFSDFANKDERIEKGLCAYERAETVGFTVVEKSIKSYKIMPEAFFDSSSFYFLSLKNGLSGL